MTTRTAPAVPPFCPNPRCPHHTCRDGWRWKRDGFHARHCEPRCVQRYRCLHCRRSFSTQTFSPTYWLKRPELLPRVFWRLLGCSGFRQIAREFAVDAATIAGHSARLGRHCLLYQRRHGPPGPLSEPLAADGFETFEYSQFFPFHFNVAAGCHSHFFYGFTDSELRRKGRMTRHQKARRAQLEEALGRPDPRAVEKGMAELLALVAPAPQALTLETDDHHDYPRAIRRAGHLEVTHHVTSSRARRTQCNPLYPVNLLELWIRHSGAEHKRETIAFARRRQSAAERLAVLQVWRNYMQPVAEGRRRRAPTPAMRLGLRQHRLATGELFAERLFPTRVALPESVRRYYWRTTRTRPLRDQRLHHRRYAF